jgi:hypothetical protein
MRIGTCGLCLSEAELQDSHLLPKALFKIISAAARAEGATNPHPVLVTPEIAIQTSAQVTDHFLCADCEDRLNRCGEKWVAANCWHSEDDFPIHAVLNNATPLYVGNGIRVYAAKNLTGVELQQLIHFAAGVFWRAAARQWSAVVGHRPIRLTLGPYETPLREFVLNGLPFPCDVALIVSVNSSADPLRNNVVTAPYLRDNNHGFRQYSFSIPGLTFHLMVGKRIPEDLRQICIVRSAANLIALGPADSALNGMAVAAARASPRGNLARALTRNGRLPR